MPKADVGPLKVPPELGVEQVLFLSDILPTGFMAVVNAEIEDGSIVAIFGAGPVGLMAVACARLKGAKAIYSSISISIDWTSRHARTGSSR